MSDLEIADTLKDALAFVQWYRNMVMEGQIQVSSYARDKRVGVIDSDYRLQEYLRAALFEYTGQRT